jgi:ureidoglycolate hydrolase
LIDEGAEPEAFVTKPEKDLNVGRAVRHHEFVAYTSRSAGLNDCWWARATRKLLSLSKFRYNTVWEFRAAPC